MPKKKLAVAGPVSAETADFAPKTTIPAIVKSADVPAQTNPDVVQVVIIEYKPLPLGIHFGLSAEAYHNDRALGSSNIKKLAKNPHNYWFGSWMNKFKEPEKDSDSRKLGRSIHKLVLEGRESFECEFVCGPDQTGMTSGQKSASTKAAKATEAAGRGRILLSQYQWQRTLIAGAMITKNPHLANIFTGGQSEVSVFWEEDGIRFKCRIDYLKAIRSNGILVANGDIKTVANQYERDFESACYAAIADYEYHVQAAHYMNGLRQITSAIRNDFVFGADKIPTVWLDRFLESNIRYKWQWVFTQTEGAPITDSLTLAPENPMLQDGREVVTKGIENYKKFMEAYGTEEMWLLAEPPREASMEHMPRRYMRR